MQTVPTETIYDIARELFIEAYQGSQGQWTWFVNNEPNCGIFGTIEALSAAQASRALTSGGRSIAAHVEHLRWSLENVNNVARGRAWNPDWSSSWSVQKVDAKQWDELRASLRREFDLVVEAIALLPEEPDRQTLAGVLASAPHAAHHLGTIRQMAKIILESDAA